MIFIIFSSSLSFAVWKGNCASILDKYMFNLTSFINQSIIQYKHGANIYYIKLCTKTTGEQASDIFVSRYSLGNKVCRSIATRYNMNYFPRNPQNFSEGLIYSAVSEPFSDDNGKTYKTSSIEFNLQCDQSIYGIKNVEISINESNTELITVKGYSSSACPIIVRSPEPTPLYQASSVFINRIEKNITFGINANLSKLSQASFGIRTNLIIEGQERILFYQPYEQIGCPPSYTCSSNNLSSAWLCKNHKNKRTCISYGINNDIYPVDFSDPRKGISIQTKDKYANLSMNLTLACENDNNFPDNLIKWPNTASIINNTLILSGSTPQVCIKKIPTPFLSEKRHLNSKSAKNVILKNDQIYIESTLYYQPNGPMICPPGFFCDDEEENSQIWLCIKKKCKSYGKCNVTFSDVKKQTTKKELKKFVVEYKGSFGRTAEVSFVCSNGMKSEDLILPDEVTVEGEKVKFMVKSNQFCRPSLGARDEAESHETEEKETESASPLEETSSDSQSDLESAVMTEESANSESSDSRSISESSDGYDSSSSDGELQTVTEQQTDTESVLQSDTSHHPQETATETAYYTEQFDFTTVLSSSSSEKEYSSSTGSIAQTSEFASDTGSFYDSQTEEVTHEVSSLMQTSDAKETETAVIISTATEAVIVSPTVEFTPNPSPVHPTATEAVIISPTATEAVIVSPTVEFTPSPSPVHPTATTVISPSPSTSASSSLSSVPSESAHSFTDHFTTTFTFTPSIPVSEKSTKRRYWILPVAIIGAGLFLYFVVGTAVVSIRDRSLHLPNRRFWMRCSKMCSKKDREYTFKLISDSD